MRMETDTFRSRMAVWISAFIVAALVMIGPTQVILQIMTSTTITFDQTWLVTIAGMAGTAFGYLIGKGANTTTGGPTPEEHATIQKAIEVIQKEENKP